MQSFNAFLDAKERQAVRHLKLLGELLESEGFKVKNHTGEGQFKKDPYLYIFNPFKNTAFDGVRMYSIGEEIVYRVQREHDTHPYGTAYPLNVEGIYESLVEDGEEKEVAKEVTKTIADEMRAFFKESARSEKELERDDGEGGLGMVYIRNPLGGDYSSMVTDKTR